MIAPSICVQAPQDRERTERGERERKERGTGSHKTEAHEPAEPTRTLEKHFEFPVRHVIPLEVKTGELFGDRGLHEQPNQVAG